VPSPGYVIRALRNELQSLDPYPWERIERWTTKARRGLQEHAPGEIVEFDKKAVSPSFPLGIVATHTDLAKKAAVERRQDPRRLRRETFASV